MFQEILDIKEELSMEQSRASRAERPPTQDMISFFWAGAESGDWPKLRQAWPPRSLPFFFRGLLGTGRCSAA